MNLLSEQKRTIIIVDDDKSILKVFTRVFEKKGYEVTTAENGKDSLDKLGHFRYNVALIDINKEITCDLGEMYLNSGYYSVNVSVFASDSFTLLSYTPFQKFQAIGNLSGHAPIQPPGSWSN